MRKLVVNEFMSLDGVVQAPGAPDEDPSGGFAHGGWNLRYFDEIAREWVLDSIVNAGAFVLGRRTYEVFASYWPNASDEERILRDPLNSKPKHVASASLSEPLPWENSTLLGDDVPGALASLKREDGGDLHLIGSSELVKTLFAHDLVDEVRLMIDPLVLGGGKRLFLEDGVLRSLRLLESKSTTTGAMLARYAQADG